MASLYTPTPRRHALAIVPSIVVSPPTPVPGVPSFQTDYIEQARRRRQRRASRSNPAYSYSNAQALSLLDVGWKRRPAGVPYDMALDATEPPVSLVDAAAEVLGLVPVLVFLKAWYAETVASLSSLSLSLSPSSSAKAVRRRRNITPLTLFLVLLGSALALSFAITAIHSGSSDYEGTHAPHAYAAAFARAHHNPAYVGVTLPPKTAPTPRYQAPTGHNDHTDSRLAAVLDAWDFH